MVRRIPHRFWFPFLVSLAGLGVCVSANFQLISWSMYGMTGGSDLVGPFLVSDIAAAVITCLIVSMSVYVVEFSARDPISGQIAALPRAMRRRATIVTGFLWLGNMMAQSGTVFMVRVDQDARLASGAEPLIADSVVFGFSFSAGDPTLLVLAIVLPMAVLGVVLVLIRQIFGVLDKPTGATSDRESVVTRV